MGSLRYLSRWSEMKFGLAVPLGAGVKNEAFNKISWVSYCFYEYEYEYEHEYKYTYKYKYGYDYKYEYK